MPNLVGIGNSQVPTNAMLGGLAYRDSVGEINIEKIKARTSDSAVDVFVYDTRKDSDGGAWRNRTQNLSWYNEGASALRGARKEFPVIAVLVLESLKLTIYDGDDPNLPMWMVVTGANNNYAIETAATCTAALNAVVCIGCGGNGHDFYYVNFLRDTAYEFSNGANMRFVDNIGTRSSHNRIAKASSAVIISRKINDVAMAVLPNSPTDDVTGLPVPTIALATNDGVSVIKNTDGTESGTVVVDITSNTILHHRPRGINFLGSRLLWTEGNNYDLQDRVYLNAVIPTSDTALPHQGALPSGFIGYGIGQGAGNIYNNLSLLTVLNNDFPSPRERKFQIAGSGNDIILGCKHFQNGGIEQISQDLNTPSQGMVNAITTTYNTGWMHGDCKLATLSDTDDTDVTGTEYVTNGYFANGLTGWTQKINGSGSLSVNGSNQAVIVSQNSSNQTELQQTVTVPRGVDLIYSFTIVSGSIYNGGLASNNRSAGTHSIVFNVPGTGNETINLWFTPPGWSGTVTIDNISIRQAEQDRSAFGGFNENISRNQPRQGVQVHGTIQKSPVASGAELVAYHGVSANNFLRQPYNSNLNFGTGDFSLIVWLKKNTFSTNHYIIDRARSVPENGSSWGGSSGRSYFIINSSGYHRFKLAGGSQVDGNQAQMPAGVFTQIGFVRRSGEMELYMNGILVQTITGGNASASFDGGVDGQTTTISRYADGFAADYTFDRMALLRISGDAPSPTQMMKIYSDEKCLFHENAKCTLFGTSIPVTAVAFDDKTNTLHAGTASGRSDFRGLSRINNTTTAVTTAISASNEFIAEQ